MPKRIATEAVISAEIAEQWATHLNGTAIDGVRSRSKDKYWWKCPKGDDHLWQTSMYLRVIAGQGCPYCANRRPSVTNSLGSLFPDLARQWAADLNEGVDPHDVVAFEKRRRWWRCPIDPQHTWATVTFHRTRNGTGCPHCQRRGFTLDREGSRTALTPLSAADEQIIAEFDAVRNFPLTSDDIHIRSKRKVWWQCSFESTHRWQAAPAARNGPARTGCPHCWRQYGGLLLPHLGRKGIRETTRPMVEANPKLATEFDKTLNAPLRAEHFTEFSNRKVWWRCAQAPDHVWEQSPGSRNGNDSGCPYCAGVKVTGSTSLATKRPELAEFWDQGRNGDLSPYDITSSSNRRVWWHCQLCAHTWLASPNASKHDECPECRRLARVAEGAAAPRVRAITKSGQTTLVSSPLAERYPQLARFIHPSRNETDPSDLRARVTDTIWWQCDIDSAHEWEATVQSRLGRDRCPFCARKRVSDINRIRTAAPELFALLDEIQEPGVDIDEVPIGSTRHTIWLRCPANRNHRWATSPNAAYSNLQRREGSNVGCPYCAGKRVDSTNSFLACEPELAKSFHPTLNASVVDHRGQPIDLSGVTRGSSRVKFWWVCTVGPDHIWQTTPRGRVDSGCPACDGKQVSVTNSLAARHPRLARQWHPTKNGDLTPDDVTASPSKKAWWRCPADEGHEWEARISDRTLKGAGCPHCTLIPRSRLEVLIKNELDAVFGGVGNVNKVELSDGRLDCDIVFLDDRLIVEYDGAYWHRQKHEKDAAKTRRLAAAGWTVIRVREEPLKRISPHDVSVPLGATPFEISAAVVLTVSRVLKRNRQLAERYVREERLRREEETDREIAELLVKRAERRRRRAEVSRQSHR